jgi:hypothetical protein
MIASLIPIALNLASEFVPDLMGSLTGKKGKKVAESVISAAESVSGQKIETQDDLVKAVQIIKSDEQLRVELQMQLSKERLETAKVHVDDRISARSMSTKSTLHAVAVCLISVLVIVGFGIMLWMVLANPLPEGNSDIIFLLLGCLTAGFTQCLNYWLGSSRSSQDKSQQMADAARKH